MGAIVPNRQPDTRKGLITIHPWFYNPLPDEELDLWEGKPQAHEDSKIVPI